MVKNQPAGPETWVQPWVRKIPWRREWKPTPVFLPGEFHRQRILASYSPWGCRESYRTERRAHTHMIEECAFRLNPKKTR